MGAVKQIYTEILEWKARGMSIEDTYIYFKDYIDADALIDIWEGN